MTEVGLGSMQALGPKWVAGYGPCRKCPRLKQKKTLGMSFLQYIKIWIRNLNGVLTGLGYLHLSHRLVEFSAVSSEDTEASVPCCSGNRCWSLDPDRWSGQSVLRWDLLTSLRLLAGFPCCLWDRMLVLQFPPSSTFLERSLSSTPSILIKNNNPLRHDAFVRCFHSKWFTMNSVYTIDHIIYLECIHSLVGC